MRFHHVCKGCGLDVVTDHSTTEMSEVKACACVDEIEEIAEEDIEL